jgi:hypothetical protein
MGDDRSRHGTLSLMAEALHVTLSGDLVGEYVVEEQLEGGRIVLAPEKSYPSVFPMPPGRPASEVEFAEHFGDLPHDSEP